MRWVDRNLHYALTVSVAAQTKGPLCSGCGPSRKWMQLTLPVVEQSLCLTHRKLYPSAVAGVETWLPQAHCQRRSSLQERGRRCHSLAHSVPEDTTANGFDERIFRTEQRVGIQVEHVEISERCRTLCSRQYVLPQVEIWLAIGVENLLVIAIDPAIGCVDLYADRVLALLQEMALVGADAEP